VDDESATLQQGVSGRTPGGGLGGGGAADPDPLVDGPFETGVRNLTLLAALAAYVGLALYIVKQTWDATGGRPPDVPTVQAAALGALAVALGAGYAIILGVPPKHRSQLGLKNEKGLRRFLEWINSASTGVKLLGIGALAYLLVGMAISVTYAFNEKETPAVLSTIAVGFGGYVIAYIGAAYQKLAP
jgi:hypothetical protein